MFQVFFLYLFLFSIFFFSRFGSKKIDLVSDEMIQSNCIFVRSGTNRLDSEQILVNVFSLSPSFIHSKNAQSRYSKILKLKKNVKSICNKLTKPTSKNPTEYMIHFPP